MRYPNRRYGNPTEFGFYATGVPLTALARRLRRDERTVRDWLSERARVPWWVPEIMRLQRIDHDLRHRQMGMGALPDCIRIEAIALAGTDVNNPHDFGSPNT